MERARAVLPGGVNSPARAYRAVGGEPVVIARGAGARLTDVDGNEYIDLLGSFGPLILGSAHPAVVAAVQAAAAEGTSFGAPTEAEAELAELVVDALPSVEMVRFVNSGTEAVMSALTARARSHRPRPHREVRGLLPRPRRRAARRGGVRPRDPRPARLARRAGRFGGANGARPLQRRERCRRGVRGTPRRHRRRHRRADRRQHGRRPAAARLPRGAAAALRRERCAARLRRGDHRLPRRLERRTGPLRRAPGPHHPRARSSAAASRSAPTAAAANCSSAWRPQATSTRPAR